MRVKDSTGCAATLCKAIHAGTEDKKREDQDKTVAYLRGSEFYDETEDEKLDKRKVAEAPREEMRHFEAMSVYRKVPYAQASERTGRRPIGV